MISPRYRKKRCICEPELLLKQITGSPRNLRSTEVNQIRLNLFTERNPDGTGHLVLKGKDMYDRYKRRINDGDIRAICLYIRETPKIITKLDLCYNKITDKGFHKILKKLLVKGRSSVINLNIMNNEITEQSLLYLSNYAKFMKIKYLRLNGNDFGVNGPEYFAKFLRDSKSLEFCDIGEINLTLTGVAHIITALRIDHGANTTLKVLDFSRIVPLFNRYDVETKWLAYHIEYLLERNSTIIELHLQKNEFLPHDVEYFARGLRRNNSLLYLDLGYNKIGDYGIELLAKYLAEKPSLILLNVAGNSINDTGARALSFGMAYSKLRALDISNNRLTDRGVLDILNSLKKPYFLRFLNIWGNKFGHVTCEVIQRMLESGALFQHTIDVSIYEVDEILYAAYYPNPADRNKHLYYCELDYGYALPIYHIKRNSPEVKKKVKVDCKQRHKLDKTNRLNF
ncbi:leucine-rich repeat-containing protein 34-like [Plodia interpunctella]|uniref:leucine-rich repeat-containing protein 34-like n=1 Tax=Plodia interpunctella TaxID=58824 RepID=UPI002368501C|nr:leucine-rich repeat-containing protein 34-like [Plodia interpunctella]